jgi:hypothetical protein
LGYQLQILLTLTSHYWLSSLELMMMWLGNMPQNIREMVPLTLRHFQKTGIDITQKNRSPVYFILVSDDNGKIKKIISPNHPSSSSFSLETCFMTTITSSSRSYDIDDVPIFNIENVKGTRYAKKYDTSPRSDPSSMGESFFFPLYQARKYVLTSWYCNSFILSVIHSFCPTGYYFLLVSSVLRHYPRFVHSCATNTGTC